MKTAGRPQSSNVEWGRKPTIQDKSRKQRSVENSNYIQNAPKAMPPAIQPKSSPYQSTFDQMFNPNPTANTNPQLTAPKVTSNDYGN